MARPYGYKDSKNCVDIQLSDQRQSETMSTHDPTVVMVDHLDYSLSNFVVGGVLLVVAALLDTVSRVLLTIPLIQQ